MLSLAAPQQKVNGKLGHLILEENEMKPSSGFYLVVNFCRFVKDILKKNILLQIPHF
jgi:hypothetical protein